MAESSCLFNCSNPSAKVTTCGVGRIETVKTLVSIEVTVYILN